MLRHHPSDVRSTELTALATTPIPLDASPVNDPLPRVFDTLQLTCPEIAMTVMDLPGIVMELFVLWAFKMVSMVRLISSILCGIRH